jgi:hypothetical protein
MKVPSSPECAEGALCELATQELEPQLSGNALLECCRELWREGDWLRLAGMLPQEPVDLHGPANVALMVAAAHMALGQQALAQRFVRVASQWGCDDRLIARVLLAGVHNTLACAAVAGGAYRARAMHHFGEAIAPGASGSSRWKALQARARHQMTLLGMGDEVDSLLGAAHTPLRALAGMPTPFRDLRTALRKQGEAMASSMKEQADQLVVMRKAIENRIKREASNSVRQLEAFASLQGYLNAGELMPEVHGWPISPDFAVYLLGLIERRRYDLIIEFGSGTSTLLMAKSCARMATRRPEQKVAHQIAFEHLEQFRVKTQELLHSADLLAAVQLVHAPLAPYLAANGNEYSYYRCQEALSELSRRMPAAGLRILLVVDGPPTATGKHARYPAVPVVLDFFKGAQIDVLLDDYIREDEKEIAEIWLRDFASSGYDADITVQNLEKEACLITAQVDVKKI